MQGHDGEPLHLTSLAGTNYFVCYEVLLYTVKNNR